MNKQYIKDAYKKLAKNFMTPNIREWELTADNRILELSDGMGIDGKDIFGVTELEILDDGNFKSTGRSQMHNTIQSARRHYNNLK